MNCNILMCLAKYKEKSFEFRGCIEIKFQSKIQSLDFSTLNYPILSLRQNIIREIVLTLRLYIPYFAKFRIPILLLLIQLRFKFSHHCSNSFSDPNWIILVILVILLLLLVKNRREVNDKMIKLEEKHNCNTAKMQNLDIWTLNYPILHLCLAKYYREILQSLILRLYISDIT